MKSNGFQRCLAIAVAVLVAGAVAGALAGAGWFLPSWVQWADRAMTADLDGDGDDELLKLGGKRFTIVDGGKVACGFGCGWLVMDAFVQDVDGDGLPEVVSLVWKHGSFGDHLPFWLTHDERTLSQHVFVHRYADGALQPVWMSSALGVQVQRAWFDGRAQLHFQEPDGAETVWEWLDWGFKRVEEPVRETGDALDFVAVGDVIAHEGILERAWSPGSGRFDFDPLFSEVTAHLGRYDVAAVNQETILVADPADRGGYPLFGTPTSMGDALVEAGFDVVCAATNHAGDRGVRGLDDTLAFWQDAHPQVALLGLHHAGEAAFEPRYVERNGIRIALFDATYGLNERVPEGEGLASVDTLDNMDALVRAVARAESQADATICFVHAGDEYAAEPNAQQRDAAGRLADAGADAVIMAHPHVVQSAEEITTPAGNHAVVFWSLGNFVSNQLDPRTVLGAAAELSFERDSEGAVGIAAWHAVPTVCHFDESGTRAYWLEDYTEDLAAQHYLNQGEPAFTLDDLWAQWRSVRL